MDELSSILFQDANQGVVLLDLPRTIEEGQVLSSQLALEASQRPTLRCLVSQTPPQVPFATPEPKEGKRRRAVIAAPPSPAAQVVELMTTAAAESALAEIKRSYRGPWCLPRCLAERGGDPSGAPEHEAEGGGGELEDEESGDGNRNDDVPYIPEASRYLLGSIEAQRAAFLSATAPRQFDLMVIDPPWPNRSARRKQNNYQPQASTGGIRHMLCQIPVASRLAPDGLVAVWVTNTWRFTDMLLAPAPFPGPSASTGQDGAETAAGGVFAACWDVELVAEWAWLKVTAQGEPVVALDSQWRRPWERLLIGRRRGSSKKIPPQRVIVAVPDLHSRKPNLRGLFEKLMPRKYDALEVFARNLTAGWWGWGDQVLKFQHRDHWVESG